MKRLIVILGVLSLSLSAVMVRLSTAPSSVLVIYRVFFAVLLLIPSVFLRNRKELCSLSKREGLLCLASGLFLGLHFVIGFESYRNTSIAAATVLINTEVFFVALGSILFLRQKLSGKAILAMILAFFGSIVVALANAGGGSVLLGNLLAGISALCMAVCTMIGAVCRRTISTTIYTFLIYLFAELTVLVIALAGGTPLFGYEPVNLATAFAMAVFCNLLGHSVFSWGLKYLPASFISTVKLLEPVFASVWALFLFGEKPGLQILLGGLVVLLGIALYCRIAEERRGDALVPKASLKEEV